MTVNKYPDLGQALNAVMREDVNYQIIWHSLENGKSIRAHVEKMDEWIFISNGEFTLTIGNKKTGGVIELKQNLKEPEVMVLHIPEGERHALKSHSFISYFVLKGIK